jgi:hypothetical protein
MHTEPDPINTSMRRIESEIKRANRALEEMNPFHRFSPEEGLYEYPEEVLFDALYQIYEILLIVTEESELPLYRQELINNWNYHDSAGSFRPPTREGRMIKKWSAFC